MRSESQRNTHFPACEVWSLSVTFSGRLKFDDDMKSTGFIHWWSQPINSAGTERPPNTKELPKTRQRIATRCFTFTHWTSHKLTNNQQCQEHVTTFYRKCSFFYRVPIESLFGTRCSGSTDVHTYIHICTAGVELYNTTSGCTTSISKLVIPTCSLNIATWNRLSEKKEEKKRFLNGRFITQCMCASIPSPLCVPGFLWYETIWVEQ